MEGYVIFPTYHLYVIENQLESRMYEGREEIIAAFTNLKGYPFFSMLVEDEYND